jgi:TonB family protein
MIKSIFVFVLSLLLLQAASAQKRDIAVYYLDNTGRVVSAKESADFVVEILPPDTSIDKNLFIIKEFYSNGKLALLGNSTTHELGKLIFQGPQIIFFPNGHKASVKNYENGQPAGDVIEYYPNGRFYNKKSYVRTITEETELHFKDCNDSTGKVLSENGNGYWITYNNDFTSIQEEGYITGGLRDSTWKITMAGSSPYTLLYKNGEIVGTNKAFTAVEHEPEFPGGLGELYNFIKKNFHYPVLAKQNGIQGKVTVSFIVERDGSLTDVKIIKGIGDGCDEEAVRIIKLSPPWKPGYQNGKPVRVSFSIPITFSLSDH